MVGIPQVERIGLTENHQHGHPMLAFKDPSATSGISKTHFQRQLQARAVNTKDLAVPPHLKYLAPDNGSPRSRSPSSKEPVATRYPTKVQPQAYEKARTKSSLLLETNQPHGSIIEDILAKIERLEKENQALKNRVEEAIKAKAPGLSATAKPFIPKGTGQTNHVVGQNNNDSALEPNVSKSILRPITDDTDKSSTMAITSACHLALLQLDKHGSRRLVEIQEQSGARICIANTRCINRNNDVNLARAIIKGSCTERETAIKLLVKCQKEYDTSLTPQQLDTVAKSVQASPLPCEPRSPQPPSTQTTHTSLPRDNHAYNRGFTDL